MNKKRVVGAIALDTAAIVAFVVIGRRSHDEDGSFIGGLLRVATPFLIGLAVAWFATKAWKDPISIATAAALWPITVVVGLLVRRFVFDDGIALPFIIVASIFIGVFLVGWRAIRR